MLFPLEQPRIDIHHTILAAQPEATRHRTPPSRQDFEWLGELQHHAADYEALKPQIQEMRAELQRRQARLNFWTREIQDCQKRMRDNALSRSPQRIELQYKLRDLHSNRDTARQEYQAQKIGYERVDRQVQSHKDNINTLMRGLRIIVS